MKALRIKRVLILAGILFLVVLNMVAYNHAWHFTHFQSEANSKTLRPEELSILQKSKVLFTGIENPKPKNEEAPNLAHDTLSIPSHGQLLSAWKIPHDDALGTVVLFHGYTGKKSDLLNEAYLFHDMGYNTVLVDFFGSGDSDGDQCTLGYLEAQDVKNTCLYLDSIGSGPLILFGPSMGAVAILKASSEMDIPPKALILESPYHTLIGTVRNRFDLMGLPRYGLPELLLLWGGFQNGFNGFEMNTSDFASQVKTPTLLFYGTKDSRAGLQTSQILQKEMPGPCKIVAVQASHQSFLNQDPKLWIQEVDGFLKQNIKTDKTHLGNS